MNCIKRGSVKKVITLLLLSILSAFLSGCSQREEIQSESLVFTSIDELESGKYYIKHDDEYYALYASSASFDVTESSSGTSDSRTLWYTDDDYDNIPTMYAGDELVYKTAEDMTETVTIERFEYVGETIGVCNLTETETGRYSYKIGASDGDVNINSDAIALTELTTDTDTETAIIEVIGDISLRSGNISRGGIILGLTKDESYSLDVYAGTYINRLEVKADCIAFTSMESYTITDYTFLRSQIARINIPTWFNNGYYYIGENNGLFRYVTTTNYDESTNFNIENVQESEESEESEDEQDVTAVKEDTKVATFTAPKDGIYRVKVIYEDVDSDYSTPNATLEGDLATYTLDAYPNNVLQKEVTLTPGEYTLTITDLYGRDVSYEVSLIGEVADS